MRTGLMPLATAALVFFLLAPWSALFAQSSGLVSVAPAQGEAGASLTIFITGPETALWMDGADVDFQPATDITHDRVDLLSYNQIQTTIHIPSTTTPGWQRVIVTSGEVSTQGDAIFQVTACSQCPAASLSAILPTEAYQGQTLSLSVTGQNTNFSSQSVLSFSGSGIQVQQQQAQSPTSFTATVAISSSAALGKRDIQITTNAEIARGNALFEVLTQPIQLEPQQGAQGTQIPVLTISGGPGGYSAQTQADLGDGITIGGLSSPSSSSLVLSDVAISVDAAIGPHALSLVQSGHQVSFPGVFNVTPGVLTRLSALTPDHLDRGHPGLPMTLSGQHTRFDVLKPKVRFSTNGASSRDIQVINQDELGFTLATSDSAAEGACNVLVDLCPVDTDSCPTLSLSNGITITSPGTIESVTPNQINAGDQATVVVTGLSGQFAQGKTALLLEPATGVTISDLLVIDADHLQAQLQVGLGAPGTIRGVRTVTETEVAYSAALLDIYNPQIVSVSPSGAFSGTAIVPVTITGIDLAMDASTTVEFLPAGLGVVTLSVSFDSNHPDQVLANISIDAFAPPGLRDIQVTAGSVTTTSPQAFTIFPVSQPESSPGGCSCQGHGAFASPAEGLLLFPLLCLWYWRKRLSCQRQSKKSY